MKEVIWIEGGMMEYGSTGDGIVVEILNDSNSTINNFSNHTSLIK